MVIIVEGIDRVGKTTLVEKICRALGYERFRDDFRYMTDENPYGNIQVNTEKINTLMNLIEQGLVDNVVLDRFHFTEDVYGLYDRDYNNPSMVDIDKRLGKLDNVVLVWVQATDVRRSSMEHGRGLTMHENYMRALYDLSKIGCKYRTKYAGFDNVVKELKGICGIRT